MILARLSGWIRSTNAQRNHQWTGSQNTCRPSPWAILPLKFTRTAQMHRSWSSIWGKFNKGVPVGHDSWNKTLTPPRSDIYRHWSCHSSSSRSGSSPQWAQAPRSGWGRTWKRSAVIVTRSGRRRSSSQLGLPHLSPISYYPIIPRMPTATRRNHRSAKGEQAPNQVVSARTPLSIKAW